jgi:hypothetical protein
LFEGKKNLVQKDRNCIKLYAYRDLVTKRPSAKFRSLSRDSVDNRPEIYKLGMGYDPNLPAGTNKRGDDQIICENAGSKRTRLHEVSDAVMDRWSQKSARNGIQSLKQRDILLFAKWLTGR